MMTLLTINRVYYLIGFVVMLLVVMTLRDRANPKRFTTALFWFLFGGIFLFGDLMVQELGRSLAYRIIGGAVIVIALLAGFGLVGKGQYKMASEPERIASSNRLKNWLFLPALMIPVVTVIGTLFLKGVSIGGVYLLDQKQLTLAALCVACVAAILTGWWLTKGTPLHAVRQSRRLVDYLSKLTYPIRVGTHYNTAFALALGIDYARAVDDSALESAILEAATRFYHADTQYPAHYEPGGDEYVSGALTEALLMSKVAENFPAWFDAFLPNIGAVSALMNPAEVSDRTDPKIAHLDGLNLSRAWCMKHIASALPEDHPAQQALRDAVAKHLTASVEHVVGSHYSGGHWLASFALLALE